MAEPSLDQLAERAERYIKTADALEAERKRYKAGRELTRLASASRPGVEALFLFIPSGASKVWFSAWELVQTGVVRGVLHTATAWHGIRLAVDAEVIINREGAEMIIDTHEEIINLP